MLLLSFAMLLTTFGVVHSQDQAPEECSCNAYDCLLGDLRTIQTLFLTVEFYVLVLTTFLVITLLKNRKLRKKIKQLE